MNTVKRCQPLLGTFVEITASGTLEAMALHGVVSQAFEKIHEVGRLMSFHDPESELSCLNSTAADAPREVHPWVHERIRTALDFSRISDGAFDISIAPHLMKWRLLPRLHPLIRSPGSWRDIELMEGNRVFFHKPLLIDMGGIAKGFAVDLALGHLTSQGVTSAIVNAGGDLKVHGDLLSEISVRDPQAPYGDPFSYPLLASAVATSAGYFSRKRRFFRTVNHLVHPASCRPSAGNISVTVFAPNCEWADALTKIVMFSKRSIASQSLAAYNATALLLTPGHTPERFP